MAIERRAHATWEGDLRGGSGRFDAGSGAISGQEVTFASRFEDSGGKTSPEELIAAAHAGCFSMALSNILTQAGNPPTSVSTTAEVTLAKVDGANTITRIALTTVGEVPGDRKSVV